MKWQAKYTVEKTDGTRTEHETTVNAGQLRDAAMKAYGVIARPLKQKPEVKNVVIWSLSQVGHVASASM